MLLTHDATEPRRRDADAVDGLAADVAGTAAPPRTRAEEPGARPPQAGRQRLGRDLLTSAARVVGRSHWPTRKGVATFFGNQLLVNAVSWTAGLLAVLLVRSSFQVRGVQNLWGLTAFGSRTLVSADDYRIIMALTAYSAGLLMMIVVRHFLLRWIVELRALRAERRMGGPALAAATPGPGIEGPALHIDE